MIEPNISEQNAFVRMMCGVAMSAFGIGRIARNPKCTVGRLMIFAGSMRIAEGYYQYCPLTAVIKDEQMNDESALN